MRDGIAKNPEPNRRIYIACNLVPLLEIADCVTVGSLFLLAHAAGLRAHSVWVSLTPCFSWVHETNGTLKPLQRFTHRLRETAEAVWPELGSFTPR